MGRVTDDDLLVAEVIDRWKTFAEEEVDDIGAWREQPSGYFRWKQWYRAPEEQARMRFSRQTAIICGYITANRDRFDQPTTQITQIDKHIVSWYERRDAERLPDQADLRTLLHEALQVVCIVRDDILRRDEEQEIRRRRKAREVPAGGPSDAPAPIAPVGQPGGGDKWKCEDRDRFIVELTEAGMSDHQIITEVLNRFGMKMSEVGVRTARCRALKRLRGPS